MWIGYPPKNGGFPLFRRGKPFKNKIRERHFKKLSTKGEKSMWIGSIYPLFCG